MAQKSRAGQSGVDVNQTLTFAYADGLPISMTADLPSGTDQTTTVEHNVVKGTSAGQSKLASKRMVSKVTYPDHTSTHRGYVLVAYNAQGQTIYRQDQAENVSEWTYDDGGRETIRKLSTVASGFDSAVRRIERTFDGLSRPVLVTQFDALTGVSVLDEVKFSYDDWGFISKFQQDPDSAIASSGGNDFNVQYTYAKATAGRQIVRRATHTLPSGLQLGYMYRDTGGLHDDEASRVTSINDGGSLILTSYAYNGIGQVVRTTYPEPEVSTRLHGTSAGSYPNLDVFNRIVASRWQRDLTTPPSFYDVDTIFDTKSNVSRTVDHVHAGADVSYGIDNLDRLSTSTFGTWDSGASPPQITNKTLDQIWTLSHTGNWNNAKLNLNNDSDYSDAGEYDDTRIHTLTNEIDARDLDSTPGTTGDNYDILHDLAGNLTDDGKDYTYKYDPLGRLREVRKRSNGDLVAEYRYNGLGFRISYHEDTDTNGVVNSSDRWYFPAYDPNWRMVAVYRGTAANSHDTSPKEEFVNHAAGLAGFGSSSLLDGVVCRYRDATTDFISESDGRFDQRYYYCQNPRGDIVAMVGADGTLKEWDRYSAYGIPFGHPAGDTDSDGDCDTTDTAQILTWISGSHYDVRGDLDLDGDVDATDRTIALGNLGTVMGLRYLSSLGNRKGYAGYEKDANLWSPWHVRNRLFDSELGRWVQRDPMIYTAGLNLFQYSGSSPILRIDPLGLFDWPIHTGITGMGLRDSGLHPACIKIVQDANASQDTSFFNALGMAVGLYNSSAHSDDGQIAGAAKFVNTEASKLLSGCTPCNECSDFKARLKAFGRALHALQDFYSHSDYVEQNGGTSIQGGGGSADIGDMPIWEIGDLSPGSGPELTSGSYHSLIAQGTHSVFNKDNDSSKRGRMQNTIDVNNFSLAQDVATRHTAALWASISSGMDPNCTLARFYCCGPGGFLGQ